MTPHDLKNSVWQLAVQGKLVEQYPDEGTGEELFQQIQSEKNSLIKAGKIKKGKMLPVISDDEKPFDLPDGWCWVRLENLCSLITDGTHKTPSYTADGVRFLSVKDISNGYFDLSNTKFISQAEHDVLTQRCKPEQGDILICRIGTLGKALAVDIDLEFSIFVSLGLIKPIKKELAKYIETVINSGYGFSWIQKVKVGGGTHTFKINLDDLRLFPIPLPPLGEQKRIVAKIEKLQPLIDRYEQAWSKLEEFNKRFPVDMQKSILQMAIQGKLVPQLPEEGTGEELFQQIQAEKQHCIKAGTIKKEKPLPEITEEEIPFDIPDSWKWIKLGEVASVLGGKRIPAGRTLTADNTGYKYIRVSDMKNGSVLTENMLYVPTDIYPSISRYVIHKEDVYITVAGTIGRVGRIPPEIDGANLTENADRLVFQLIDQDWLIKCLESSLVQQQIIDATTKVGQPKLAIKRIQELLIPLPPLAEQKRIVAKLEEILPLCERLK